MAGRSRRTAAVGVVIVGGKFRRVRAAAQTCTVGRIVGDDAGNVADAAVCVGLSGSQGGAGRFGVRRSWRRTYGGADWFGCGNGCPFIDVRGGGQTDCLGRFGHDSVHFAVDTVFPWADPVRRSVQHAAFCRLSLGVAGRGGLCIRCGSTGEKTQ